MSFRIPEEQRVLTYSEYEALGYKLRRDYRAPTGSYTSYSVDLNPLDLAYRAETKEEYYIDAATGLAEVGLAYATGGTARLVRTVYGLFLQHFVD